MTRITLLAALLILGLAYGCGKDKNTATPKYTFSYSGMLLPNNDIQFTSSAPAGSRHMWLLGDGGSSTLAAPTHAYATHNDYLVKLVVDGSDTVREHIVVCDDPIHTSEIAGIRSWHHYYISGSVSNTRPDTAFALAYVDRLAIRYRYDTLFYVPGSNTGETISFSRAYQIPGMLSESYDVLFSYVGNSIILVRTIPTSISTNDIERFVSF